MTWDPIIEMCNQTGFTDRGAQVIFEYYLAPLAEHIEKFAKDAAQKEAFLTAFGSAKKIAFSWDDQPIEGKNYHWIQNDGGVLAIHVPKARFNVNTQSVGDNLMEATQPSTGLDTRSKMSLRDFEPEGKKQLDRIKAATGVEYQLVLDWLAFDKVCSTERFDGRLGQVVYTMALKSLADAIEKICKDDLAKEAFVESSSKKVIQFKLMTEAEVGSRRFNRSSFEDGAYVLNLCTGENFLGNMHTIGDDIESIL